MVDPIYARICKVSLSKRCPLTTSFLTRPPEQEPTEPDTEISNVVNEGFTLKSCFIRVVRRVYHASNISLAGISALSRCISGDLSALLKDITERTIDPESVLMTPRAKLSHVDKLFRRRWGECAKRLRTQWQAVNYVSAVFIG